MRSKFFAMVAVVGLALMAPAAPVSAADAPPTDWVSVDTVLVNRLGGVSVSGEFSCAATFELLKAGQLEAMEETEEGDRWYTIEAPNLETDEVLLFVNADNYTVTQPAGKRLMIKVQHGSSRMTPCYTTTRETWDGNTISEDMCPTSEGPCRWETDRYAYDREKFGPLFDYSDNGKFKVGNLNVEVYDYGVMVALYRAATELEPAHWEFHTAPYAADVYFNDIVRAVGYR
jgi:hypothetical protein